MKRFSKLIVALIGVLSLTSCMNLMPTVSRRSRRNSSEEDFSDSTVVERSNKDSNKNSSLVYYEIDYNILNPTVQVGEVINISYRLRDNNWSYLSLSNASDVDSVRSGLSAGYTVFEDHMEVQLFADSAGTYDYRVNLVSKTGVECSQYYYLFVTISDDDPENYYVEHDNDFEVPYLGTYYAYYRIINRRTANNKYFDPNHPFDADFSSAPSITIDGYELVNNNTALMLMLRGLTNTSANGEVLYVKLIDQDGYTYNTETRYIVKPSAYISLENVNNIFIEYGETVSFTAHLYSGIDGSRLSISKEGYDLRAHSGYMVSFEYIDNTKIIFNVTNYGNSDEGWFGLTLVSEDGYSYECWFVGTTNDYFYNHYWVQYNGEYYEYQQDSYFVVILFNRAGNNKLIKDLIISSQNGIVPNATITDINNYTYEYHFVPTRRGRESWTVTAICYDGTQYTGSSEYVF